MEAEKAIVFGEVIGKESGFEKLLVFKATPGFIDSIKGKTFKISEDMEPIGEPGSFFSFEVTEVK